ncbi:MAG: ATP synthase F0 subunit B [Lachnospiraceae bacterium]|nr:ATP synthase F0 subunit B [Lachnospiraceae bacterium]
MLKVNMSIVYTIINLLILYAFFRKFLFGRVNKILQERRDAIENAGRDLDAEITKTRAEKAEYETKLKELETEKESTLAEWRGRGFEEHNRIVEEAKVEASRIIAEARKSADMESAIALEKNQKALKDIVVDAAGYISVQKADPESEGALYDTFIRELNRSEEAS